MSCKYCGEPLDLGPIYAYCKKCRKHFKRQRSLSAFAVPPKGVNENA